MFKWFLIVHIVTWSLHINIVNEHNLLGLKVTLQCWLANNCDDDLVPDLNAHAIERVITFIGKGANLNALWPDKLMYKFLLYMDFINGPLCLPSLLLS